MLIVGLLAATVYLMGAYIAYMGSNEHWQHALADAVAWPLRLPLVALWSLDELGTRAIFGKGGDEDEPDTMTTTTEQF